MKYNAIARASMLLALSPAALAQSAAAPDDNTNALPPVRVTASAERPTVAGGLVARESRLGILGDRDYMETPFSLTSYTDGLAREQQARSVADVIGNSPTVRKVGAAFSTQDNLYIRGFLVNTRDIAFDGLYGLTSTRGPLIIGVDRFDVLTGPGAALFGMPPAGNVGGVVNLSPKRAQNEALARATVSYLSDGLVGASVDLGRRFADGKLGVRFNADVNEGDTPIDGQRQRFGSTTTGIDWRSNGVRLSADIGYQHQIYRRPSVGLNVAPGVAIPAAPDGSTNFAQPWEHVYFEQRFAVARAEADLSRAVTAYVAYGGSKIGEDYLTTGQRITNAAGDTAGSYLNPYLYRQMNRAGEAGMRAHLQTGPLTHDLVVGITRFSTWAKGFFGASGAFNSNIYAPTDAVLIPSATWPSSLPPTSTQAQTSTALVDTISALQDRLQVTLGVRRQKVETSPSYRATKTVPVAAVLLRTSKETSIYASAGSGLGFGATAPDTAKNAKEVLPPIQTKQAEVGAKLDLGTLGGSVALFQITRPSAFTDPVTNVYGLNGEQRNRGIELNAFGEPANGLRVVGGLVVMKGEQTATQGGTLNGKDAPGVPHVQANAGVDWAIPGIAGLRTSARVTYTASQFYDNANTQSIPAWTRLDLGASYELRAAGRPLTLRASVDNATNRAYWSSTGQGILALGGPRTVRASVSTEF